MSAVEQAEKALKNFYLGVASDQLNTAHPFLSYIDQTTSDVWGKEIRKLAPLDDKCGYLQYVLALQNLYGSVTIPEKTIKIVESNTGAFVNLLEAEMEGLLRTSKFNFGRMLHGDGSGIIGRVVGVKGNRIQVTDVKNFIKGLYIDIFDDSDGVFLICRKILQVDMSDNTIVLDGAAITPGLIGVNDFITLMGAHNKELCGLRAIFSDSETLYGLKRADCLALCPLKITSAVIDDDVIQSVIDEIDGRAGSWPNFIICSAGVKRAYQNWLMTYRSNIDVINLRGGYKAISYNGIPIVSDRFCPEGTMYLLNTDDFNLHQLCDWRWLEGDDGFILKKQITDNSCSYKATLVKYANLICDRPWAQAVITGIKEA